MNLASGVAGIIYCFRGNFEYALYFILIAGVFDFFDGFLARVFKSDGLFGRELDSLADVVTFGVLPSVFLFRLGETSGYPEWICYTSILIAIFSAVRLATFNLDESQTTDFKGLPTPANAIMLCTLGTLPFIAGSQWVFLSLIFISSWLLVSPMRMMGLKFKNFRIRGNEFRYIMIVMVAFSFIVIGMAGLPYLIPSYILLSVISNFASKATDTV